MGIVWLKKAGGLFPDVPKPKKSAAKRARKNVSTSSRFLFCLTYLELASRRFFDKSGRQRPLSSRLTEEHVDGRQVFRSILTSCSIRLLHLPLDCPDTLFGEVVVPRKPMSVRPAHDRLPSACGRDVLPISSEHVKTSRQAADFYLA